MIRLLKPARKLKTIKLSSVYYYAEFELVEGLLETPKPLQFVNVWIPGVDEMPMSISKYTGNNISILFKVVGEGTRALRDRYGFFGIKGPLGKSIEFSGFKKILFVAGGVGIAPLPYLADYAHKRGVEVDVVWGTRKSDMLFNVKELTKNVGEVHYATEDCAVGFCGRAIDLALKLVRERKDKWDVIIGVGPTDMLRELCNTATKDSVVYVSLEALIKCGYGACGSCVLRPLPKLLCRDGPVFKCEEVIPYLESKYGH